MALVPVAALVGWLVLGPGTESEDDPPQPVDSTDVLTKGPDSMVQDTGAKIVNAADTALVVEDAPPETELTPGGSAVLPFTVRRGTIPLRRGWTLAVDPRDLVTPPTPGSPLIIGDRVGEGTISVVVDGRVLASWKLRVIEEARERPAVNVGVDSGGSGAVRSGDLVRETPSADLSRERPPAVAEWQKAEQALRELLNRRDEAGLQKRYVGPNEHVERLQSWLTWFRENPGLTVQRAIIVSEASSGGDDGVWTEVAEYRVVDTNEKLQARLHLSVKSPEAWSFSLLAAKR
jgi:hypothetical protein